jgi:hypothetical protein
VPQEGTGTTGFYQIGDLKTHSISSNGFFADAATCASSQGRFVSANVCCAEVVPPVNVPVAEVATFDVTSFGLIPPFQVVGP